MYNYIKDKLRSAWYSLATVPRGFFGPARSEYYGQSAKYPHRGLIGPQQALTLSPVWAAVRKYQTTLASLPLVTYQRQANGSRERYGDRAIYSLLHDRPNPAMSRATFFKFMVKDYFLEGNCYAQVQWSNNHRPLALYPIPARTVTDIRVDDAWNKTYVVQSPDGQVEYHDDEIIHLHHFSQDGIRGVPFWWYALKSLGLHTQVLDSATSYYENSVNPSVYLECPGKLPKESKEQLKTELREMHGGPLNRGSTPIIDAGARFNSVPNSSAADAQIVEALGASVPDVARWFGLSPLMLADLTRGTYSNLGADNIAFYQSSLRPLLDEFELELNHKLFGSTSDTYCEFLVDAILRADPITQAKTWQTGIQAGYLLRSDVREWLNLPAVEGLDRPIYMANLQAVEGDNVEGETPTVVNDADPV